MRHELWPQLLGAGLLAGLCTVAGHANAIVLSEDELEERSTEAGVVARSFTFLLTGDILDKPFSTVDTDPTMTGIFDVRGYFAHKAPAWSFVVHEQLTLQARSHAASGLPIGRGLTPARWLPLSFDHTEPTLTLRSDVDWLYVSYTRGPATITIGRQPITFGRGRVWRTTDRISTFSVTEVDTTFKPGSDAVRVDLSFEKTFVSLVAALGELEAKDRDGEVELRASSVVLRSTRGFEGGELGLFGGFVRYDAVVGIDGIVDLGPLDMHAEVTVTRLTAKSLSTPIVVDRRKPVLSAVIGATWRPVDSLILAPEAGYNGFGSYDEDDYLGIALSERVAIGEQTTFGKLHLALTSDWRAHALTHVVSAMIFNLHDPSALLSLAVRHDLSDDVHFAVGGYAPMGPLPDVRRFAVRSEYGNYPYFFFTHLQGTI